jgi:thiol-disulfide isomerase/thioredoxin
MEKITSVEQFEQAKQREKVVFQFSADWCPDCRFLDMFFQEIIDENKDFTFYYVDRDQFIELCQNLDIFGIPSFVAFNNGEEIGRYVNKDRKTKEQVEEFLEGLRG